MEQGLDPVEWVDPNIGGVAYLLAPTVPTVQLPHGMIRLAPSRAPQHPDPWLGDHILSFPLNIISYRGLRAIAIAARTGGSACHLAECASEADHFSHVPQEVEVRIGFSYISWAVPGSSNCS